VAPLITAVISEYTPREHMGMSMGILGSFEDIGMVAGPALYGFVWAAYSPRHIFIVSGVAQLVGALLLFTIKHEK
jgi:MFS family permease